MSVWFTSDLHLGHRKMAELREYPTLAEHDWDIIEKLNEYVGKKDKLFVLGDIAFSPKAIGLLGALRVRNVDFVLGNHDKMDTAVYLKYARRVGGAVNYKGFWLTHIPVHPQEIRRLGNIHGHIHAKGTTETLPGLYYCVNVDLHDMRPVNLETIQKAFGVKT